MAEGALKYAKYINIAMNVVSGVHATFAPNKALESATGKKEFAALTNCIQVFSGITVLYISCDYLISNDLSTKQWQKKLLVYGIYEICFGIALYKYRHLYSDSFLKVGFTLNAAIIFANLYAALIYQPKKEIEQEYS